MVSSDARNMAILGFAQSEIAEGLQREESSSLAGPTGAQQLLNHAPQEYARVV